MYVKHTLKPKGLYQRKGGMDEFKMLCMELSLVKYLTGLLRKKLNVRNTMILKIGIVCISVIVVPVTLNSLTIYCIVLFCITLHCSEP